MKTLTALVALTILPASAWAQTAGPRAFAQWDKIEISVTAKLAPNLFVLQGSPEFDTTHPDAAGGRVAVLFGPDGVLMVDAQDEELGEKVFKTHPHVHRRADSGARQLAHSSRPHRRQRVLRQAGRDHLRAPRAARRNAAPADAARRHPAGAGSGGRAAVTYGLGAPGVPAVTIQMNGEVVDFIPVPASHTGGDTVVRFQHANAIYIGDFYRNFGYPFADQANGGSIHGMIVAIDLITKLAGPDTTLITGHGTMISKPELQPYRAMILDIRAKTKPLVDQGKSLDEVLAANLTAPYDATTKGDTPQSNTRFITEVFNEVKNP